MNDGDPRSYCHAFVTGTDTGVGKTVVSAALCRGLALLGRPVRYWKPIQTGVDEEPSDASFVRSFGESHVSVEPSAWVYGAPRAPDQAATLEGREPPEFPALVTWTRDLLQKGVSRDWVIEGAGGLLVPLDDGRNTWRDLLASVPLAPLVVARTTLGTLNHTCLTVEVLENNGTPPAAVILCGDEHPDNLASLRRMMPHVCFLSFPRLKSFRAGGDLDHVCRTLAEEVLECVGRGRFTVGGSGGDWQELDRRHTWHPFTQHALEKERLPVVAARGCYLHLADGRRLFDGIGSWWTNTLGHGRGEFAEILASQQRRLDHVLFAGMCHEPAARLAAKLADMLGGSLTRVFFSDNGSTSVEVALKMVRQFWVNRGEPQRTRLVAFRGSYHGDTFGAMSVGAESGFFEPFRPMLFGVLWVDVPTVHRSRHCPEGEASFDACARKLEDLLEGAGDTVAGVIVEPLVQGATGMLVHSEAWLKHVERLCRERALPLIFDEVFTGLGRLGRRFAFERAGVTPDIVCLSKALTGGLLPMGVTVATEAIFEAFLSSRKERALLHGHSYTANPILCRVALEALSILEREELDVRAATMEGQYRRWLNDEAVADVVRNPRCIGSILAFEVRSSEEGYFGEAGKGIADVALERGLFIRPLGNTVYLAPPLTATESEIGDALSVLKEGLLKAR